MRLQGKFKYFRKLIYSRLLSLKRILVVLLLIALGIIATVDFGLIKYLPDNKFFLQSLNFSSQLSYAYLSAFIFYFLVVHLSAENRKARIYRQLNNKILAIARELQDINFIILDNTDYKHREQKHHFSISDLSLEEFKEYAMQTNPQTPPQIDLYSQSFQNWFAFLKYKREKIREIIKDLLFLKNTLDDDVLRLLIYIDNEIESFPSNHFNYGNITLETWSHSIYKATFDCEELIDVFIKRYERYRYENGYFYIKQRSKMKSEVAK